jgi:hypothetical protein
MVIPFPLLKGILKERVMIGAIVAPRMAPLEVDLMDKGMVIDKTNY